MSGADRHGLGGRDFALTLVARMRGDAAAQAIQLAIEYDPAPPFAGGHPDRREQADRHRVTKLEVAVPALVPGAGQRDDRDHQERGRLGFELVEREEDDHGRNE